MNPALERRVLVPSAVSPSALRGAASGLAVAALEGSAMGTGWKLRYQSPRDLFEDRVHDAVDGAFELVVRQMSHWQPDSELGRFNRAPAGTWHRLSSEFFSVLTRAVEIARDSGGTCDPTLGEIVDLHGFGPLEPAASLPTDDRLAAARSRAGWSRLQLDSDGCRALQPGGCQLDLSSIAKGYAVDLAGSRLLDLGVDNFLLDLGGELIGRGCKPDGQPWWVAIETPAGLPETVVALCDLALATSGDTVKRRRVWHREISHLIDPATALPTDASLLSVSVFADACIDADAWATALYVAGPERGPRLADSRGLAALFTIRAPEGHRQQLSAAARRMLD